MFETIERWRRDRSPVRASTSRHSRILIICENDIVTIVTISLLGLAISLLYFEHNGFHDIEYMVVIFNSL